VAAGKTCIGCGIESAIEVGNYKIKIQTYFKFTKLISRRKRNNDTCVIRRNENISPVSSVLKT
jgi:hypothetical protein